MKAGYQSIPTYSAWKFKTGTIDHCEYFVKSSTESAAKMKELAAIHEEMARLAETK